MINKKIFAVTGAFATMMFAGAARAEITSRAWVESQINPVETKIDNHIANTDIHVTSAQKTAWNAKVDADDIVGKNGIDVSLNNTTNKLDVASVPFYGSGVGASSSSAKTVSIPTITTLSAGQIIVVNPATTHGTSDGASSCTIQLNNSTAAAIKYNGSAATKTTCNYVWRAGVPAVFVYDGLNWDFVGGYHVNSTYSVLSVSAGINGTATTARSISAANLKQIIQGTAGATTTDGLAPNAPLTGIDTTTTGAVSGSDTIMGAIGKLQATKADSADLAAVATSGSYNDLSDKPTMPTVNNATLTIQKNGTAVDTFTANAAADKTINITVPTTAADVGAVPTTTTVNGNALSSNVTLTGANVAVTGYTKPASTGAVAATDTVNAAIGKLEKALDGKQNLSTADYQMGNASGGWTTMTTQQQNMLNGRIPVGAETNASSYAPIWVE